VSVGEAEGLKHPSVVNCDQLTRLEKSLLTDYIGKLSSAKVLELKMALPVDKSAVEEQTFSEGAVKVPAGEPIFIAQRWVSGRMVTGHCKSLATFVPKPGAVYRLTFGVNFAAGVCPISVDRLSSSGDAYPVASLRYFHHPNCDSGWTQP